VAELSGGRGHGGQTEEQGEEHGQFMAMELHDFCGEDLHGSRVNMPKDEGRGKGADGSVRVLPEKARFGSANVGG
jgi:hypothetical protein